MLTVQNPISVTQNRGDIGLCPDLAVLSRHTGGEFEVQKPVDCI